MSADIRTIQLASNGSHRFETAGQYFEVIASDFPFSVDMEGPDGNLADTLTNIESGFFVELDYRAFTIRNPGGAQAVKVLVMDSRRGGTRRQPGTVNVVDNSTALTVANTQFITAWTLPADPAKMAAFALKAMSKRVTVRRLLVESSVAARIQFGYDLTGAAIMFASGPDPDAMRVMASKRLGGAVALSRIYLLNVSPGQTLLGMPNYAVLFERSVSPGAPLVLELDRPIVLEPSVQLAILSQTVNAQITVQIEAEEA